MQLESQHTPCSSSSYFMEYGYNIGSSIMRNSSSCAETCVKYALTQLCSSIWESRHIMYRFASVLLMFFVLFCFLHCVTWIVSPLVLLQRNFQEALKCSHYTERGTPASSLIRCGSAWQGWASCYKEYLIPFAEEKEITWKPFQLEMWEFQVLSTENHLRSWNWERAFVHSMCLAPVWFSYASKQDAFGNQSAHPCFINHLSASAKISPPPHHPLGVCGSPGCTVVCEMCFLCSVGDGG